MTDKRVLEIIQFLVYHSDIKQLKDKIDILIKEEEENPPTDFTSTLLRIAVEKGIENGFDIEHKRLNSEIKKLKREVEISDQIGAIAEKLSKELVAAKEENLKLRERLQFDPGGSDKIDELEQALQFSQHEIETLKNEILLKDKEIEGLKMCVAGGATVSNALVELEAEYKYKNRIEVLKEENELRLVERGALIEHSTKLVNALRACYKAMTAHDEREMELTHLVKFKVEREAAADALGLEKK